MFGVWHDISGKLSQLLLITKASLPSFPHLPSSALLKAFCLLQGSEFVDALAAPILVSIASYYKLGKWHFPLFLLLDHSEVLVPLTTFSFLTCSCYWLLWIRDFPELYNTGSFLTLSPGCSVVLSHPAMSNSVTSRTVAHQAPLLTGFSWRQY